jgi:hypothetical protein
VRQIAVASIVLLQLAGCTPSSSVASGTRTSGTPTSGTPTPSPARPPFIGLLKLEAGEGHVSFAREVADTAQLLTTDYKVVAQANFKARMVPHFAGAEAALPAEAHVVAGALYYADGDGVVWRLRPGAQQPAQAASFQTQASQHELSFAVAPDGTSIEAILYEFGPIDISDQDTTGPTYISLLQASSPTTARVLWKKELENGKLVGPQLVGWDAKGPLIADVPLASSEVVFSPIGGLPAHVSHLDAAGNRVLPLGGADCLAAGWQGGWVVCTRAHNRPPYEVRDAAGSIQWTINPSLPIPYEVIMNLLPSPDGKSFFSGGAWKTAGARILVSYVFSRDGTYRMLTSHFIAIAWVGTNALLGYSGPPEPNFLEPALRQADDSPPYVTLTDPLKPGTWYVVGAITER